MSNTMSDSTITESKYATLAAIHDFRELGDSWPKAIRSSIPFKYLLGCQLLKVGEAITRAGYKLSGEEAVQDVWALNQTGTVEALFDIGREYQRRVTARKAATA
jgi:hypothetical protein